MTTLQTRRGTLAEWSAANPILAVGEPGFETDAGRVRVGDGVTAFLSLPYIATNIENDATYDERVQRLTVDLANPVGYWSWESETFSETPFASETLSVATGTQDSFTVDTLQGQAFSGQRLIYPILGDHSLLAGGFHAATLVRTSGANDQANETRHQCSVIVRDSGGVYDYEYAAWNDISLLGGDYADAATITLPAGTEIIGVIFDQVTPSGGSTATYQVRVTPSGGNPRNQAAPLGKKAFATGYGIASGENSFATGQSIASGWSAHAEGALASADGSASHAEGFDTHATGGNAHAEGSETQASGGAAHAEGSGTTASGYYSHAEGYNSTASGYTSHVEGQFATASGVVSHAQGAYTTASGHYTHAAGYRTTASHPMESAMGAKHGTFSIIPATTNPATGTTVRTLGAYSDPGTGSELTNGLVLDAGRLHDVRVSVLGVSTDGTLRASWEIRALVFRPASGNATTVGTATVTKLFGDTATSAWTVTYSTATGGKMTVQVTSDVATRFSAVFQIAHMNIA